MASPPNSDIDDALPKTGTGKDLVDLADGKIPFRFKVGAAIAALIVVVLLNKGVSEDDVR